MRKPDLLLLITLIAALLSPGGALAEEETGDADADADYALEPLTVTAEKQEKDAQDIPGSVSVLTDVQLDDYNIQETSDVFQRMPNLFIVKTGPKAAVATFTAIRGITSYMGGNPPVGVYVDDVYYPGYDINLFDVERVEVLRGPQGTLYGHNTEGGVINVVTRQPESEWRSKIGLGYGNYNTRDLQVSTGGALVEDKLYLRAAAKVMDTDGYFTNKADGSDTVDKQDEIDFRGNLRWTPTKKWDVRLTTDIQDYSGNYAEFASFSDIEDDPHEVDVDYDGNNSKQAVGTTLRASCDLTGMRFLSVTSFRHEEYELDNDVDFTSASISNLYVSQRDDMGSQEFRLSSDEQDSPFKWLSGLYLFVQKKDRSNQLDYIPAAVEFVQSGNTRTKGGALFGQASYILWDSLELTAGLRYDRESQDFEYEWSGGALLGYADTSGSSDKTFQAWLPKLAATYHFTDDLNVYASVARGSKSGGFNTNYNPGEPFESEYTWSYETGLKSMWLDNRLQLNLAAFLIKWEDMQVEIPMSSSIFYITNAGKATSQGFEAEVTARLARGWEVFGGLGFVHSVFDEYDYNGDDLSGNRVPNVPAFSTRLGSTYRFENGFFVNGEWLHNSAFYWDVENSEKQDAYEIVNAKVGYEHDKWEAYLWGKNLFNTTYVTRAFQSGSEWYGRAGDPLTFGLTAALTF